jgi:putative NADPH-quinone reductase
MRAVVVYCHPIEGSFCSSLRDAAVRGLQTAGHDVTLIDVTADNFDPVMTMEEWDSYFRSEVHIPPDVATYVEAIREAEILAFVYPTWWSSVPAQLKGWMERVLVPEIAFTFSRKNKIRPGLKKLKHVVVVTTFGSPRLYVRFINDNGSRLFRRSLRSASPRLVRNHRFVHYKMDKSTPQSRSAFQQRVEAKLARL